MSTNFREQLSSQRTEQRIKDLKPAFTQAQAVAEANRCLYCHDAPCIQKCATAINIPEFIRKIATGNLKGAAKTILSANILGSSCARVCPVEVMCAGDCVYNNLGEKPIEIGRLQRFAVDWAMEHDLKFFHKGTLTGKKIALIGGGPASLACAAELVQLGHEAVVLEKSPLPGGLNTTGVAPYKMRAEASLNEVQMIQDIGVDIRTGIAVGQDVTFAELEQQYDAIFIGAGLGPDSRMRIPGEEKNNCFGAVALIEQLKLADFDSSAIKRAVVVGGGNTALDTVRELKKIGIAQVTMVYRRTESEMSGYAHEMEWAKKEGIQFCFLTQPLEVLGHEHVTGLKCTRMALSAPDESGRSWPEPVTGSEFVLEADLVAMAIGQEKLTGFLGQISGLNIQKGCVQVDAWGQTANPKYFAGGDCVNGGREVVNAAAEGKLAAHGIDRYLKGVA